MRKWTECCVLHPNLHLAKAIINNISLQQFWSLTDWYPDLVCHLHVQVSFMGNLGLSAGVPWLSLTNCPSCLICKKGIEHTSHFCFDCMSFRETFDISWSNLKITLFKANSFESIYV